MSEASTVWCLVSVSTVDLGNHCPFFWNFLERRNLSMIYIKSGFRSFMDFSFGFRVLTHSWRTSCLAIIFLFYNLWGMFCSARRILVCFNDFPSDIDHTFGTQFGSVILLWYLGIIHNLVWTSVFWVKSDFMKSKMIDWKYIGWEELSSLVSFWF